MNKREAYEEAITQLHGALVENWCVDFDDFPLWLEAVRSFIAEQDEEIAHLRSLLRATQAGQETLIECIAELKEEQEKVAREAWEEAIREYYIGFEEYWQARGK